MSFHVGNPCARGHNGERYSNGACRACTRDHAKKQRSPVFKARRRERYAQDSKYRLARRDWGRKQLPVATRPCPETCEVCDRPPGRRALSLDHCHATGMFRGWLCTSCNLTLGHVEDSPARLRALAAYLESK